MTTPKRNIRRNRSENIRKLVFQGNTSQICLPREVTAILRAANVAHMRITITDEGVLLTPYREEPQELPKWAREVGGE